MRASAVALVCGVASAGVAGVASAATEVTFDGYAPGTVITSLPGGISVSVENPNPGSPDRAIIWDYQNQPKHIPGGHQSAAFHGGNVLGAWFDNGLIIEGHIPGEFERRGPAGHFIFDFETPLTHFGVTFVDFDDNHRTTTGSFLQFFSQGQLVGHVEYHDFYDPTSDYYDPTIAFGNGSVNRTQLIGLEKFHTKATSFDRVTVAFGGSQSLAGFSYQPVPSPTAALAGAVLLGAGLLRRRTA